LSIERKEGKGGRKDNKKEGRKEEENEWR
jgi:hypothetical protein